MIRAGILGAGYIAQSHARGYGRQGQRHPAALPGSRVRLAVVADRHLERAEALAQPYGAKAVSSLEALLDAGVDAVSICTGTASHAGAAIAAMHAGKHVLCEKPMARTAEQAERMIQVARATGVKLMIGHVCRFEAEHRKAKEVLDRGDLGLLRMGFQSITSAFPTWNPRWYADPAQSGGPVLDLAIHSIDSLLWWFGRRAVRVHAVGTRPPRPPRAAAPWAAALEGEHNLRHGLNPLPYALISLRMEGGGIGLVETSWAQPQTQGLQLRTELVGDGGRLEWDYGSISPMQVIGEKTGRRDYVLHGEDSFAAEIAAFVECIERDTMPAIPAEEGLAALRVALAALESLHSGEPVCL